MVKKQLIMEKALELFARQGFEATSVQQITEHCGISKGAFYLSFKSKDELIIALIDHFMMQVIADIDHIVRGDIKNEILLYKFYYTILQSFHNHSDFAKLLMKEQSQTLNDELMQKLHYYNSLLDKTILLLLERLYGKTVSKTKYDLMYCVKGFMSMYSHLFLFFNLPLDLDQLVRSLVEKTNILAEQASSSFLSKELVQITNQAMNEKISIEQILPIIDQKISELEESIEKDSLILLKQHLIEPTLSPAIVKGLQENIRNHPHCKWIAYLIRRYYGDIGSGPLSQQ
ncbi:TetR/AcrR family transcriptional regulator [Heyndrickxia oleronia]|uniref:TetR/AcrR family transcriptional regulator n=1 Tax=Heyndrickxia oleronia TaxID=38875 RepID=UPI00203C2B98|nr:TetR/AcrR family transcriptional regulator [Heyndrickxia oleronia]MCM3238219.1 TetR/AcrR family transcriptional regulator [Heyndrickxia oleronia]